MPTIDPTKLKTAKEIGRPDILFCVARVPDSTRLWAGSSDGKVYELDPMAEPSQLGETAGHEGYVTGVCLTEKHVVSGAYDGRLIWWDRDTREQVRSVEAHTKWIRGVVASPDSKLIASVADDMVCRLWNAETGELVRELRGHDERTPQHFPSMLYACAFSADGAQLATADKLGRAIVWDVAGGNQLASVEAPLMYTWDPKQRIHSIGGARSVAFSPDGRLLALGGTGQINNIDHLEALARVEVFDWRGGERTHEFPGDEYKGLVERLAFDPEGKWLLAAGGDHGGFVKIFDIEAGKVAKQDKAPMHVHDFAVSEQWDSIYAVGHNKLVVWQFET